MLTILTTHPIQYQVPIWQTLAGRGNVDFEVWYLSDHGVRLAQDKEFGLLFNWDIDLLSGYPYRFLSPMYATDDITSFYGARFIKAASLFEQHQVTALWINGWRVMADWQAVWYAHRYKIPLWLRAETNDLRRPGSFKHILRSLMLRIFFHQVSAFLYIGTANKRFYKNFGVPEHRLYFAPYCVDNDRFTRTSRELLPRRSELRRRWGIPEHATCFLFSGKLIPKKRPFDLIAALMILFQTSPDLIIERRVHLLIVGDGELRLQLTEQANELTHLVGSPVVTFAGFLNQSEIAQAYVAADCLVLPSDERETWGLVVNEALACGLPAVVSDRCGCAEDLVLPLGEEHVYPCGDAYALARCLRTQIEYTTRDRHDEYTRLAELHSILHTVKTVEMLYRKILYH